MFQIFQNNQKTKLENDFQFFDNRSQIYCNNVLIKQNDEKKTQIRFEKL